MVTDKINYRVKPPINSHNAKTSNLFLIAGIMMHMLHVKFNITCFMQWNAKYLYLKVMYYEMPINV